MGVRVEICVPQEYPPYCIALLEALFADHAIVAVIKHFTEGQSGTFVLLVEPTRQDGEKELPVVVKIGPSHLLEQEWRSAQDHVVSRLPDFVPISEQLVSVAVTAEDGSIASYSAARYQLAGNGIFAIETLRTYALTASTNALWTVLEKRLFQQLDRIWTTPDAPVRRQLSATYDRVLPVNLLLEFAETTALPPVHLDATLDPASFPQFQPGDWVQLNNFVITEIDAAVHTLTLNLPPPEGLSPYAYRLRIRNVANLNQYNLHETIGSLMGCVLKTRHLLLEEALRDALPATIDLTQSLLTLPESNQQLPNPLQLWPALLQEELPMRIGTVHGDLNMGNVLVNVDAKTTFIIDCAHAHRDHVLYDLARLESEVLLHMVAAHLFALGAPPTAIHELYSWLDFVTQRAPNPTGSFSLPQPLLQTMPRLQTAFIALTTIRNRVRQYLAGREQWREYYMALTLTLLGSLKFASLDRATAGINPKAIAFWGAATLLARLDQPAKLMQIGWQNVSVDEVSGQQSVPGSEQPNVYIGNTGNTTNIHAQVIGSLHTGSGPIYVNTPAQTASQPHKSGDEPTTKTTVQPDSESGVAKGAPNTTDRLNPPPSTQRPLKILFLAANPLDTARLRIDEEARAIDQALRQAEQRIFAIHVHQAVRVDDLQDLLLRHRPDIVHFSGHGTAANELILQDVNGKAMPVSGKALRALFEVLQDQIRCVVLNACYTEEQAKSLAEVIACVVGISNELSDAAAIQFAAAFYRSLGYGRSVQEAFRLGQTQIGFTASGEEEALQLFGAVAAQTYFVDKPPTNTHGQNSNNAAPKSDRATSNATSAPQNQTNIQDLQGTIHTGSGHIFEINLFQLPFKGVKTWASEFFRIDEEGDHPRSNWEARMLYRLGAPFRRISGENFLTSLLAVLTVVLAIWFIAPILTWPQPTAAERFFATLCFGIASLILPALIALLIKPAGADRFAVTANVDASTMQRNLLILKLAGAWTGFDALAGTALIVVILWYHLLGRSMPTIGQWFLALLPPFFAYVSARQIPLDRYKMFNGELRLHEVDRLFLAVFALFCPALAAFIYWGHEFLINQAALLSVLLGIIGLTVWEMHRRDKERFPDLLVITILGFLLPLGFLLLFFFDIQKIVAPPIFVVGLFVVLATYVLGTALLLATVSVRQQTIITLRGAFCLLALLLVILGVSTVNLWLGRAVLVSMVLLWYLWGRRQLRRWQWWWLHPSVDCLIAALIGTAVLGRYTTLALWANVTLFGLVASVLIGWAYRNNGPRAEGRPQQESTKNSRFGGYAVALLLMIAVVGVIVVVSRNLVTIKPIPTPPATITAKTPIVPITATSIPSPTLPTTLTPTITSALQRARVVRPAPGTNRYFIEAPDLARYELGDVLAVYAQDNAGHEFDAAVVLVVDKNVGNLIVQVIFQNANHLFDSLAALQLDDRLDNVDVASMTPVGRNFVGFMLNDQTARLVADVPVKAGAQLEALQLTNSGEALSFPDRRRIIQIDSISTNGHLARVSSTTELPPLGTLLVLTAESSTSTPSPSPSPAAVVTQTATVMPLPEPTADLPIYESFDGIVKLTWENTRGEWGVNNQRLQVRRFTDGLAGVVLAHPQWLRYAVRMNFGTLQHWDDSGNVNVPFSNFHVLVHFQGDTDGYWFTVANGGAACTIYQNGVGTRLTSETTQWSEMFDLLTRQYTGDHELEITVRGNQYAFRLDDKEVCNFRDDTYSAGSLVVVVSEGASGQMWIDNVRIAPLD